MNKIKKMSDILSNMIAAGEVVEKPVNVMKELVDNAVDAEATVITISLVDQGLSMVSVEDNGIGMSHEDAKLASIRHATSKLYHEKDLQRIQTLGFRGEALAAIASVSRLVIETKDAHEEGISLTYEAGLLIDETVIGRNQGTKVTVSALFFNTPARFKFMSSDALHQKQLRQTFYQLALAQPHIAFTLIEDDKIFKKTSGSNDVKRCMAELFGTSYAKSLIELHAEVNQTDMTLWVLPPEMSVSHKQFMYTFINQRYVKHYGLIDGIMSGYDGLLMVKRYPVALCYITMDPSRIDVNIHPQKLHVKLTNESVLKYQVEQMIKTHFKQTPRRIHQPLEEDQTYHIQTLDFDALFESSEKDLDVPQQKLPSMTYIGMLAGTYGLFQHSEGLALLDAHAAAERVRYEHYTHLFEKDFHVKKQRIVPYLLNIDQDLMQDILNEKAYVSTFGFQVEETGVHEHPAAIREEDILSALEHLLEAKRTGHPIQLGTLKELLAKDISCKGAIKANQRINKEEMMSLYHQLKACELPYQCPHGRPTIIMLSYLDIEKMFKRIVT